MGSNIAFIGGDIFLGISYLDGIYRIIDAIFQISVSDLFTNCFIVSFSGVFRVVVQLRALEVVPLSMQASCCCS